MNTESFDENDESPRFYKPTDDPKQILVRLGISDAEIFEETKPVYAWMVKRGFTHLKVDRDGARAKVEIR